MKYRMVVAKTFDSPPDKIGIPFGGTQAVALFTVPEMGGLYGHIHQSRVDHNRHRTIHNRA
jgi:hypothetical protein